MHKIGAGGNGSVHDWVVFGIERTTGSPRCGYNAGSRPQELHVVVDPPVSLYKACIRG